MMKFFTLLLLLPYSNAFPQHNIGFTSITRFDQSRPAVAEQEEKDHGRIMQINFWYPAETTGTPITFGDYVALVGLEMDSSSGNDYYEKGVNKYFAWPESAGADKKLFLTWLGRKTPIRATFNALMKKQQFPLVMLVHGYAADHAYLAENIASKGFIVMQVPVKGTVQYELDYQDKGLESQVLDYEFALEILKKEFHINAASIGVVGFSFGGQSAMALAIRNEHVRSVVSLDGGIGSAFGVQLLKSQLYYDHTKIKQPILHLYNGRDEYTDLAWLKTVPETKRFLVGMKNMEHGHFTSFGMLNRSLPGILGHTAPDPGRGCEGVVLLATSFLETSMNKAAPEAGFLSNLIKKNPWLKLVIETDEFTG